MAPTKVRGRRGSGGKGPFIYDDFRDNHAIWPGSEPSLDKFLRQSFDGISHKMKNARSSNSEDALTWSCFDTLRNVSQSNRALALAELWELAYGDMAAPDGLGTSTIEIGKSYSAGKEATEVDLSFEGDGFLVLVEAKLYSPMSQADPENAKPHNQIERKLRIGLRDAQARHKDFYFILLDIAPANCLAQLKPGASLKEAEGKAAGFGGKWLTAYWFSRYKYGHRGSLKPLRDFLSKQGLDGSHVAKVADRMGWLTWADVFKVVLRAVIPRTIAGLLTIVKLQRCDNYESQASKIPGLAQQWTIFGSTDLARLDANICNSMFSLGLEPATRAADILEILGWTTLGIVAVIEFLVLFVTGSAKTHRGLEVAAAGLFALYVILGVTERNLREPRTVSDTQRATLRSGLMGMKTDLEIFHADDPESSNLAHQIEPAFEGAVRGGSIISGALRGTDLPMYGLTLSGPDSDNRRRFLMALDAAALRPKLAASRPAICNDPKAICLIIGEK